MNSNNPPDASAMDAFPEVWVYLVYIESSIRSGPNGPGNRAGNAIGILKVKTFDVQEH